MKEKNIQTKIRIALSKNGIVIRQQSGVFYSGTIKTTKEYGIILTNLRRVDVGVNGITDLLFIGNNGKIAFIEVKNETGKASADQLRFIEILNKMGHKASVVRSVDEAEKLCN